MDPEIVEMVRFLDPEIVEKVDKSYIPQPQPQLSLNLSLAQLQPQLVFFLFLQRGGGKFHNSKPSSLTTSMAILGNYIETYEKEK